MHTQITSHSLTVFLSSLSHFRYCPSQISSREKNIMQGGAASQNMDPPWHHALKYDLFLEISRQRLKACIAVLKLPISSARQKGFPRSVPKSGREDSACRPAALLTFHLNPLSRHRQTIAPVWKFDPSSFNHFLTSDCEIRTDFLSKRCLIQI